MFYCLNRCVVESLVVLLFIVCYFLGGLFLFVCFCYVIVLDVVIDYVFVKEINVKGLGGIFRFWLRDLCESVG